MQATIELEELDELVTSLDTEINEVTVTGDAQTPSLLLCSYDCGSHSWYRCW